MVRGERGGGGGDFYNRKCARREEGKDEEESILNLQMNYAPFLSAMLANSA